MKAIILDDSRTDAHLAAQVAKVFFDEVEVCGTPMEFKAALNSKQLPELILMDIHIGDLHNGIAEVDTIRRESNEASIIPIIVVTASTNAALHKLATDCGASGVIVKPISKEKLAPLLAMLVPQIVVEGK